MLSAKGGSHKLIDTSKREKLKLIATPRVIVEVASHLEELNLKEADLENLLSSNTLQLVPDPPDAFIEKFRNLTPDPDDAHILGGAVLGGADFLLSLDRKHILTLSVRRSLRPIFVFSPKEFWSFIGKSDSF
ncbi:PIN domain-containing protein [Candidatus Gottesmanbacteria bacterium]|nr:PIN domain-containing protein [Candidatus Gottesmanbacteria bacterium]